jgi:dTDP-4-dehydrorhamnose reductase
VNAPKKRILITGSNGLLGQKLVKLLAGNPGIHTIATSKGNNRLPYTDGYDYISMDITHPADIDQVLGQSKPDVVIHTAAMTHVDQCELNKDMCWQLNVTAVESIAAACQLYGIFLVHLSTDFVFDGTAGPYKEDDVPNPVSFYGWSKFAAEKAVMSNGAKWAIVRTVLVYGIAHDMSRSNIILWVKKSLEEGKAIKVVTDQLRTPTLAEDLAMGCFLIADHQHQGIFHISGKDFLSPYEMALSAADYFGLDQSLISSTNASAFKEAGRRPPRTGFILTKAHGELGYEPHSFREGIALLAQQIGYAK